MIDDFAVTSDGNPVDAVFAAIEVMHEANRIPYARLVIADQGLETGDFPLLDGDAFRPGATVTIAVTRDDAQTALFTGRVTGLSLDLAGGRARLAVECRDPAVALTRGRRHAVWSQADDATAIRELAEGAGLTFGAAPAGGPVHEQLVQNDATGWDFLVARAEAIGALVVVTAGTLSLVAIRDPGGGHHAIDLADPLFEAELELDALFQHPEVEARGLAPERAATLTATASLLATAQGDLDPADVGGGLGIVPLDLVAPAPLPEPELRAWADARLARVRRAMLRGRVVLPGLAAAPGDLVTLSGMGRRFDGEALVAGVRHRLDDGGWRTDLQLGLSPRPFARSAPVAAAPVAGLLPPASSLMLATVADYEDDPAADARVRVLVPALGEGAPPIWARLLTPDAGKGRGFVFRPDKGDEVVLGFIGGDPRWPVVLGSLFGAGNTAPDAIPPADAANEGKGMMTRNGAGLLFTDRSKPAVSLTTKDASLTIDDDAGTLTLADAAGNRVELAADGLSIVAAGDLTIEAKGKLMLKGASVEAN